jgi:hypothetical protein
MISGARLLAEEHLQIINAFAVIAIPVACSVIQSYRNADYSGHELCVPGYWLYCGQHLQV